MVSAADFTTADLNARLKGDTHSADKGVFMRVRYNGPKAAALVEKSNSVLLFYIYSTGDSKYTLNPSVGSGGILHLEASIPLIGTKSKAGEIASIINAWTHYNAWLQAAFRDTAITGSLMKDQTLTSTQMASDEGGGLVDDSTYTKYRMIAIQYQETYRDSIANTPVIKSAGDIDWKKQTRAQVDDIFLNGHKSATLNTLEIIAVKWDGSVETKRTIYYAAINSLNNAAFVAEGGKDMLDKSWPGRKGERLIVRLTETNDTLIGGSMNVSGKVTPHPRLGA